MARSAITKRQLGKIALEVGIEGLPEVLKNIDLRTNRMLGLEAKKVWMRAALAIVREIRDNIHSLTGHLAGAIFAAYGRPEKPNVLVGVRLRHGQGPIGPHAGLVEKGHINWHSPGDPWKKRAKKTPGALKKGIGKQVAGPTPPHPFFKPGAQSARPVAGAILAEGMRDLATKP